MTAAEIQPAIRAALAAHAAFAALDIFLEIDPAATAAQLAELDARFEAAMNTRGFALAISYPRAERLSAARGPGGALHLRLICQIAFIENPSVNRASLDPERPELTPAGLDAHALMRTALAVLLAAGFEPPTAPIAAPELDEEGLILHGLLVGATDHILALYPAP